MPEMKLNYAKGFIGVPVQQNYDPDQPRDPKGSPTGGQWTGQGVHSGEQLIKVTARRDEIESRMATIRSEIETTPTRFSDLSDDDLLERRDRFNHQATMAKKDGREADYQKWESKYREANKEVARRREMRQLERQLAQTLESLRTGKLTVTESEMRQILGSAGDTYHDAGYRGEYNPDLFITSDLSGAKIRHYVRLPDGRIAHPDELIEARRRGRIIVIQDVRQNYDPDQPRDPKGSPTGGRWTSGGGQVSVPYPAIGDSPTSFLIEYDLKELPENHMDGLRSIDFVEDQYVLSKSAASGEITEAYGIYSPNNQTITLSSNKDNVGVIGGGTIVHEVGHHVHLYKLTDKGAAEWARISGNGNNARISAYARTNQGEHFAEAYRAYMLGGNKRKSLKALESQSYKYMRNLDKHLLPAGEHANVGNWYQRYKGE